MKKRLYTSTFVCITLIVCSGFASAGQVSTKANGAVSWRAGITGIVIDWAPNGAISAISSKANQAVVFPDREGINKAFTIAEEKAKAGIVRFMTQRTSDIRVVTQVNNDLSKAQLNKKTGEKARANSTDTRTLVSNLSETIASFGSHRLPGVIVLKRGYNPKTHQVSVTVGISRRTIGAANALQNMLSSSGSVESSAAPTPGNGPPSSANQRSGWMNQPASEESYPNNSWK